MVFKIDGTMNKVLDPTIPIVRDERFQFVGVSSSIGVEAHMKRFFCFAIILIQALLIYSR
jgi:hypothetical protein